MENIKTLKLLAILFVSSLTIVSCSNDDDDHDHDHEEELITTVTYELTSGMDVVTLEFQDIDGDGSAVPTYTVSGPLTANTSYTGSIELLNETESPAEDITEEVEEEGDEHEFFITTSLSDIIITKTDSDENGHPIGIESSLITGEAGTGTITIILKHEPTKPNDGTSVGAGGSTDVEVTFNINVQ